MSENKTYIQLRRERAAFVKGRVCEILGWTDLEYAEFQFETGITYLERYLPEGLNGVQALERSRLYWSWWRNSWLHRDEALLQEVDNGIRGNLTLIYKELHNPCFLVCELSPPWVIFKEGALHYVLSLANPQTGE